MGQSKSWKHAYTFKALPPAGTMDKEKGT